MNARSLLYSLGLHVALGILMIWASHAHVRTQRPLPQATVVKLIRPAAIEFPKPSEEIKFPEPKPEAPKLKIPERITKSAKKPLEIPKPTKTKPEPVKQEEPVKSGGEQSSPKVPKELVGEGVTLKLNNPGFEYDFYLGLVQSKIEQNFRPPPGKTGMAVVTFVIKKTGEIMDVRLVQPSGNLLIDQAAQRAVRAAGRFPPLPAQYGSDQLAINIEFVANPAKGG
jgi:protein TonB